MPRAESPKPTLRVSSGRLPETGYVRQSQLIPFILPLSPATLWRKVKAGHFPSPVKLSERITAWRVEDIRAWMNRHTDA
jgi:predicted DNA-binding transcriptional regulator AlpA